MFQLETRPDSSFFPAKRVCVSGYSGQIDPRLLKPSMLVTKQCDFSILSEWATFEYSPAHVATFTKNALVRIIKDCLKIFVFIQRTRRVFDPEIPTHIDNYVRQMAVSAMQETTCLEIMDALGRVQVHALHCLWTS